MISRALGLLMLIAALGLAPLASTASADCTVDIQVTLNGQVRTDASQSCVVEQGVPSGSYVPPTSTPPVVNLPGTYPTGTYEPPPPMALPWECRAVPTSSGANPDDICAPPEPVPTTDVPVVLPNGEPAPAPVPVVTTGMVAEALRRVELPAATLTVQPPNGRTLVNFETNFYTDPQDFTRTLTLLGQQVDLRISAAQYSWTFGDGTTSSTTTPGAPFPALDVTHRYLTKGTVGARVDTTYTAEFSVGNGPWQPVPGSVTITGDPIALQVVTATPVLVG